MELTQQQINDLYTQAAYENEAAQGYEGLYYGPDTGPGELKRTQKESAGQPGVAKAPSRQVENRLGETNQVQRPYTTDWLDAWLENNNIDLTNPEDIASLNDATQYMLYVVGAIEPVEMATSYGGSGGSGAWYSGGWGGYGGGGGGGGGGYNYGRQADRAYGNSRYANSLGLVSWRI